MHKLKKKKKSRNALFKIAVSASDYCYGKKGKVVPVLK
jgi:hypothetical protein